ncbi:MAG: ABC transporter ATP-binding protein [Actinomycetota bacterium]|nr:ABC transporter ATP-binding protein [Actinomycetota bacterium]
MAEIHLERLTKHFGDVRAVEDLTLDVPHGSFVALLGPSGCGKTTTMNLIAGLETPTAGEIYFDGRPMSAVDPGKRNVGFVFQNYAIFTHMRVYDNLAFGLRVRKHRVSKGELDASVHKIARLVGVTDVLDRKAGRLSVNDMQKVALGRSMIVTPAIFLLDEPFSNLDAAFRAYMRAELKRIQHEIRQTMIYVTHDQVEAMGMADKIAVMNLGVLQQYGTPAEIYNRPATRFVASFVGSVLMNFIPCRYEPRDGRATVVAGEVESRPIDVSDRRAPIEERVRPGERLTLAIRPERVRVVSPEADEATLQGKVTLVEPLGAKDVVHLSCDGSQIRTVLKPDERPRIGERLGLVLGAEEVHLFDDETGLALR